VPQSGWYPDPTVPSAAPGHPQRERYWDGHRWTELTRDRPPPRQDAGSWPELGSPAQPTLPWAVERPPSAARRGRRTRLLAAAAVAAAVLVAAGVVAAVALTGSDDPVPVTTPAPSPTRTGPIPLAGCPSHGYGDVAAPHGGRISSGRLSARVPAGWRAYDYPEALDFFLAKDPAVALHRMPGSAVWEMVLLVGRLPKAGAYRSTRHAAESVAGCLVRSENWFSFTDYETDVSEPVEIDGHEGWHTRLRVRLQPDADTPVEQEAVTVVVVDLGPGPYGMFLGDQPRWEVPHRFVDQHDRAMSSLRVD